MTFYRFADELISLVDDVARLTAALAAWETVAINFVTGNMSASEAREEMRKMARMVDRG